jgi:hypothetical protein
MNSYMCHRLILQSVQVQAQITTCHRLHNLFIICGLQSQIIHIVAVEFVLCCVCMCHRSCVYARVGVRSSDGCCN